MRRAAKEFMMANSSDFTNIAGMSKDMRDRVVAAFDALSNWRDEIATANERCLGKVLDQTSAVARSMGWPDEAAKTTRDYLQHTAKVQTQLIDQLIEGWKQQLKSPIAPMAIPRGLTGHTSGPSATMASAMPGFDAFAPWKMWLQAAEMWQRTWMPEASKRSH
jgi:hypothetical protein